MIKIGVALGTQLNSFSPQRAADIKPDSVCPDFRRILASIDNARTSRIGALREEQDFAQLTREELA